MLVILVSVFASVVASVFASVVVSVVASLTSLANCGATYVNASVDSTRLVKVCCFAPCGASVPSKWSHCCSGNKIMVGTRGQPACPWTERGGKATCTWSTRHAVTAVYPPRLNEPNPISFVFFENFGPWDP